MRVILLLFFVAAIKAAPPKFSNRIIGGSVTTISEYPEIVNLMHSMTGLLYMQACGGSLLNQRAVLSAAHCLDESTNPARWRLRVGSHFIAIGGKVHNVARIINHPNFNRVTADNDIAVLHSASIITYVNNAVRPARIAGPNYNVADNQSVWAAGWGDTEDSTFPLQLRHVEIWTVNQDICRERYATVGDNITDNMLCAGWLDVGGRDMCTGDSGGPLLHNGVVVGVCSFGRGCADPFYPGVTTRVSRYTAWIQANAS